MTIIERIDELRTKVPATRWACARLKDGAWNPSHDFEPEVTFPVADMLPRYVRSFKGSVAIHADDLELACALVNNYAAIRAVLVAAREASPQLDTEVQEHWPEGDSPEARELREALAGLEVGS